MVVLSKFLTFTVAKFISITSPSAPNFSLVIQSPIRTISFTETEILATNPIILSLKINNKTAETEPKAVTISKNFNSKSIKITDEKPNIHNTIIMTCM